MFCLGGKTSHSRAPVLDSDSEGLPNYPFRDLREDFREIVQGEKTSRLSDLAYHGFMHSLRYLLSLRFLVLNFHGLRFLADILGNPDYARHVSHLNLMEALIH